MPESFHDSDVSYDTPSSSFRMLSPEFAVPGQALLPGVYQIFNLGVPTFSIDLSGQDNRTIIAYGSHDRDNQKWEFSRLGAGYSIRSLSNGAYVTLDSGVLQGTTLIANDYPVSWGVELDDLDRGSYRIGWPGTPLVLDIPDARNRHKVKLSNRNPPRETKLWGLKRIRLAVAEDLEFETRAPEKHAPEPVSVTTANTVIDAEGHSLGESGELTITTTTTTTTTSVTRVKRL